MHTETSSILLYTWEHLCRLDTGIAESTHIAISNHG